MRVIRGQFKSRRFSPPKKFPSRPTTDFAKESLFNIIEHQMDVEGMEVMDIFAGTGNISLEFVSRGAKVLSIDSHYVSYKFIKQMIKETDTKQVWHVLKQDVFKMLPKLEKKYDLVFADPPFALKEIKKIPNLVFENDLLKPQGILIVEHGKETDFSDMPHFQTVRNYGGVQFSFFEK